MRRVGVVFLGHLPFPAPRFAARLSGSLPLLAVLPLTLTRGKTLEIVDLPYTWYMLWLRISAALPATKIMACFSFWFPVADEVDLSFATKRSLRRLST